MNRCVLPYGRQTIDDDDVGAVVEALRAPLLTCGPRVAAFESALADYLKTPHVSACSSGTAALHLAYAALGVGEGDEVITSPITFSATAAAAYYVGATVRFADVDPATGHITAKTVEPLITSRTRAIVPVHLGGLPVDLDPIIRLARARQLFVVEDGCHALGASYRDHKIGAGRSDAVVFSFHPVKHITTLEGGAVVTRSAHLKARVERLRQHGIERDPQRMDNPPVGPWVYEVQELGWNYRLSDVACALGRSQLAKLDQFVAARRELAAVYRHAIEELAFGDRVVPPARLDDRESAHHLFAVAIDFAHFATTRAAVMQRLADAGIATQVHYVPLLDHPLHAARCPLERASPRPGVDQFYARTLTLPLFPAMTADDARRVIGELASALTGVSR